MRLYLVRHAPTAETGGILTGRLGGVPLSDAGRALAEERAADLGSLRPAALYSSPLERCLETAEILGRQWRLEPIVSEGLIEADYGRWSGRTLASLRRLKAWRALFASASRFRFPDGETLREVQSRAVETIEDMAAEHRARTVVAVSHADVIRVLIAHYLGMPLDLVHRLHVHPGGVSIIDLPSRAMPPLIAAVNSGGSLVIP